MKKWLIIVSILVFLVTLAAWAYGLLNYPSRFLVREAWLYAGMIMVPAALVCTSLWVLVHQQPWRIILGVLLLVPSTVVWLVSMLLAAAGFKIH